MKIILIVFYFFIGILIGFSQDIVDIEQLEFNDNDLVYINHPDSLFTGRAQLIKRDNYLKYEEFFENGVLLKGQYYQKKTGKIKQIYEYYPDFSLKCEVYFNLRKNKSEHIYYDENGKKIKIEEYDSDKLVYSCEYNHRKKHGKEFCIINQHKHIHFYENGKLLKEKSKTIVINNEN